MVKGVKIVFLILTSFFAINLATAAAIDNNLHLNIQVINSSGDVNTGTFTFTFNISTTSNCANVVYTNKTSLTTDSRGIISYYLENANLNYSDQYWLCYYRNNVLVDTSKIARDPYSFRAKNITLSGVEPDTNFDMGNYNLTTTGTGFFGFLGSLVSRITSLFVQNIDFAGNINGSGNITTTGKIGVGTEDPTQALDVRGQANFSGVIWVNNNTQLNGSTYNVTYATWAYNQTIPAMAYTDIVNTSLNNRITIVNDTLFFVNSTLMGQIISVNDSVILVNSSLDGRISTLNSSLLFVNTTLENKLSSVNTSLNLQILYNYTASLIANTSFDQKILVYNSSILSSSPWNLSGTNVFLNKPTDSVGVGTDSPDSRLTVNDSGVYPLTVRSSAISTSILVNNTVGQTWGLASIGSSSGLGSLGDFAIWNVDSNTPYLTIQNTSGNIGVGTTTPSSKMEVVGTTNITGGDATTKGLYVDSTGKVGIGTATPNDPLDVVGNIRTSSLTSAGNKCVYADSNGVLHIKADDCGLAGAAGDDLGSHIASQNIQLGTYWLSGDGGNEGVTVNSNGYVGIGTSTSPYMLTANGNVSLNNTLYVNAGKVGIGTSNPTQTLDVRGVGNFSSGIYFNNNTLVIGNLTASQIANISAGQYQSVTNTTIASVNNTLNTQVLYNATLTQGLNYLNTTLNIQNLYNGTASMVANLSISQFNSSLAMNAPWNLSGTNVYLNNPANNVGIGTTDPNTLLEVNGTDVTLRLSGAGTDSPTLQFLRGANTFGSDVYVDWMINDTVGDLIFSRGSSSAGSSGNSMTLDNLGNVGIGTTTPSNTLDVRGQGNFSGTVFINNNTDISLWASNVSRNWTLDAFTNWNTTWDESYIINQVNQTVNIGTLYNQTAGIIANTSAGQYQSVTNNTIASVNTTANVQNLINGTNANFANVEFNNGWTNGGASIVGGNLYAQGLYVYNITALNLSTLNVNGSLLPSLGYDNTFDLGNSSLRWNDLYLGGDARINGTIYYGNTGIPITALNETGLINAVNTTVNLGTIYNQTASMISNLSIYQMQVNANESYLSTYNATYAAYASNVSRNWTLDTFTNWNATWDESYIINQVNQTVNIGTLYNQTAGIIANTSAGQYQSVTNNTIASVNTTANIGTLYNQTAGIIANTSFDQKILVYNSSMLASSPWNVSGTDVILNKPTNYVGVGTTDPSHPLELVSNLLAANAGIFNIQNGTRTFEIIQTLGAGGWNPLSAAGDIGIIFGNSSSNGDVALVIAPWASTANGIRINSSNVNIGNNLYVSTTNVGIGTVTPTQKLHVQGNANVTNNLSVGNALVFTDNGGNMVFQI